MQFVKAIGMKIKYTIPAILLLCMLAITARSFAQSGKGQVTPFRKGSVTLNLGVGFGTDYKNEYASSSAFGTKAALEFGVIKAGPGVVSFGIEAGATTSNKSSRYYNDFRSNTVVIAGRTAWHYGWKVPGLDTYGGLSAGAAFYHSGYRNNGNGNSNYDYNDVFPVIGGFVGASYFFTRKFGVNAEAGFDITSLQAGVIFKFK
ncbi:MAG: hypothetical protein H7258_03370 [Ferruginibacter sp.]|nr:hypothetical protein [Ferruginibacter sp.]